MFAIYLLICIFSQTFIDISTLTHCPAECTCNEKTKIVLCSEHYFQEIPQNIPTYVEQLILSSNKINKVKRNDFSGLINVKKLQLHQNQISIIEDGSFKDLSNLTELYMSENSIIRLSNKTFEGLMNLETLWIRNALSNACIEDGVFAHMKKLENLLMSENEISFISDTFFRGPGNLSFLMLSLNQVKKISENAFIGLPLKANIQFDGEVSNEAFCCCSTAKAIHPYFLSKPTSCTLSRCSDGNSACNIEATKICEVKEITITFPTTTSKPSTVPYTFFPVETTTTKHTTNVITDIFTAGPIDTTTLPTPKSTTEEPIQSKPATLPPLGVCPDYCYCYQETKLVTCNGLQLTRIPNNIPADVKKLSLSSNRITRIRRYDFYGLTDLEDLDINSNSIEVIDDGSFESLGNLTALYLNHNNLKRITEKTFTGLGKLKTLWLAHMKKSGGITIIHDYAFAMLKDLEIFLIQNNKFLYVSDTLLYGLDSLKIISFSPNLISVVSENAFQNLPKDLKYKLGEDAFDENCCCSTAKAIAVLQLSTTKCNVNICKADGEICNRDYTSTGTWNVIYSSPPPSEIRTTTSMAHSTISKEKTAIFIEIKATPSYQMPSNHMDTNNIKSTHLSNTHKSTTNVQKSSLPMFPPKPVLPTALKPISTSDAKLGKRTIQQQPTFATSLLKATEVSTILDPEPSSHQRVQSTAIDQGINPSTSIPQQLKSSTIVKTQPRPLNTQNSGASLRCCFTLFICCFLLNYFFF